MAVQRRDILGPSLCGPSSGDGANAQTVSTDAWTGAVHPQPGVKASQPAGSGDNYDEATTSRLAELERAHIQTSYEACNFSAGRDGGFTGTGEVIGGTDSLRLNRSYGDAPTDQGDTGKVVG